MSTTSYVQVPPDSTGKKLHSLQHVVGANTVQVQGMHLADPTDPTRVQHVDERGQASVRFAEGSPTMNAFGALRVSTGKVIGVYDFTTDSADDLFSDTVANGGSVSYMSDASTCAIDVTTTNGSLASRVSNKYHFYWPGNSNLYLLTVANSNTGVAGNTRRWGMFDTKDGVYFKVEGTALKVELRSSVTGVVTYEAVDRADWNGDKLDGTGLSGFTLNLLNLNIYWLDYQWLGGGFIRLGVVDQNGNRIVAHTFKNANARILPYIRTGTLPLTVDNENTAGTGSSSSIRLTCASVHTDGEINYTYWRYAYDSGEVTVGAEGVNVPIITARSKPLWGGKHNTTTAFPETLEVYVTTGAIKLDMYWDDMVFTGATYALDNGSTVEADNTATATTISTQLPTHTFYLNAGVHSLDLSKFFEANDEALNSRTDEAASMPISFIATMLTGAPTVYASLNYKELR